MNSRIWDSVGAMTGIAFAVLLCVGAVLVGNVDDDLSASSPSSEIASALAEQADRVEIGSFIASPPGTSPTPSRSKTRTSWATWPGESTRRPVTWPGSTRRPWPRSGPAPSGSG